MRWFERSHPGASHGCELRQQESPFQFLVSSWQTLQVFDHCGAGYSLLNDGRKLTSVQLGSLTYCLDMCLRQSIDNMLLRQHSGVGCRWNSGFKEPVALICNFWRPWLGQKLLFSISLTHLWFFFFAYTHFPKLSYTVLFTNMQLSTTRQSHDQKCTNDTSYTCQDRFLYNSTDSQQEKVTQTRMT